MGHMLKIAIIGDYNFTYNSHQATNLALDHSGRFLEIEINYYWIKISDAAQFKTTHFEEFDGIMVAPGPYQNLFFLNGIIRTLSQLRIPVLLTGESLRSLIEVLISSHQLNPNGEKLISDNLVEGSQFETIHVIPHSSAFVRIYENHNTLELTSSRYSLYPQLIDSLTADLVDVEAYNQFEEPEVISLRAHTFFVSCGYCPQISSTREIPHPLIYTFLKASLNSSDNLKTN
jgi:CTP synthase (UTP-ammonia lyase)